MPDIYQQFAADAFEKSVADVTPAERDFGMNMVYARLYGETPGHMVQRLGIPTIEAERCIAAFKRFPSLCKS